MSEMKQYQRKGTVKALLHDDGRYHLIFPHGKYITMKPDAFNYEWEPIPDTPRPEIMEMAMAMEGKMRKHDPERGDTWKTDEDVDYLRMRLAEEYGEWADLFDGDPFTQYVHYRLKTMPPFKEIGELVDIANFCMMLYHRLKETG